MYCNICIARTPDGGLFLFSAAHADARKQMTKRRAELELDHPSLEVFREPCVT